MPLSSRRKVPLKKSGVRLRRTVEFFPCSHRAQFEPASKLGELAWCKPCGERRLVGKVLEAWSVDCATCQYARFFEWDERAACRAFGRHKTRKPGHTVYLFHNGRPVAELDSIHDTLPLGDGYALEPDGSVIPF